jgi:hypothetical protein
MLSYRLFYIISLFAISLGITTIFHDIYANTLPYNQAIQSLISQAQKKQLHNHKRWHQLMHYKPMLLRPGVKSQIVSPNFFLANNGHRNPEAELISTIYSYFVLTKNQKEYHPQCRFPARYLWLKTQLEWPENTNVQVKCLRYLQWSNLNKIESIDAVFVTGYFGNPASFYGHIVLKLNDSSLVNHDTALMDQSINFGARVPPNENPIRFLVKGIFGGYTSLYTDQYFYQHTHYYTEKDLRDLWLYQLRLSKFDRQLLVTSTEGCNFTIVK